MLPDENRVVVEIFAPRYGEWVGDGICAAVLVDCLAQLRLPRYAHFRPMTRTQDGLGFLWEGWTIAIHCDGEPITPGHRVYRNLTLVATHDNDWQPSPRDSNEAQYGVRRGDAARLRVLLSEDVREVTGGRRGGRKQYFKTSSLRDIILGLIAGHFIPRGSIA